MSQINLSSYENTGLRVAAGLANAFAAESQSRSNGADFAEALASILKEDPPSLEALRASHMQGFLDLARTLRQVFRSLVEGRTADAADTLNAMLAKHPANPHLAEENGVWRLHHHPADTGLVEMWTSICAEAFARLIGDGHAGRIRFCEDSRCRAAFFDTSRNSSRRFCTVRCQNRTNVAAYRARRP